MRLSDLKILAFPLAIAAVVASATKIDSMTTGRVKYEGPFIICPNGYRPTPEFEKIYIDGHTYLKWTDTKLSSEPIIIHNPECECNSTHHQHKQPRKN